MQGSWRWGCADLCPVDPCPLGAAEEAVPGVRVPVPVPVRWRRWCPAIGPRGCRWMADGGERGSAETSTFKSRRVVASRSMMTDSFCVVRPNCSLCTSSDLDILRGQGQPQRSGLDSMGFGPKRSV